MTAAKSTILSAKRELAERRCASHERVTRAAAEALRELRARRKASESAKAHSHEKAA